MNTKNLLSALLVCLLMLTSLPAYCRKPVLKKTRWTALQEMFVADAGTMTITTEDGRRQEYTICEDGTITREEPYGETLIFQKQALQP